MANEVAEKKEFGAMLTEKLSTESIAAALPEGFNKARFVQNCISFLNDNGAIFKKYSPQVIMAGLLKGAYLNLDAMSQEYYLIPYGDRLNFQTSYKGQIKLVKRYSTRKIRDIYAKVIREGDEFSESIVNGVQTFSFIPKPLNNAEIIGAFAVIVYEDGSITYDVMNREEIDNTRKHSKAANSGAWREFFSEMAKKTVLRRLCKYVDIDFENARQQATYTEEAAIETDAKVIADVEIEENANTVDFAEFTGESGETDD